MKKICSYIFIFFFFTGFAFANQKLVLRNTINGLTEEALNNAEKRLQIAENLPSDEPLTVTRIREFYRQGPNEIQQAIQPFGYFKAKITSQLVQQGNTWQAYYKVNPGEQLRITYLHVQLEGEGADNPALLQTLKTIPLQPGNGFSAADYNKAQDQLLNTAHQQGYLMAFLSTNTLQINLLNYTSIINLILNTGPCYYFGKITFSPNPINESLLKRYLPFAENSPYSAEQLINLQQTLSGTGYYKSVVVTPALNTSTTNRQIPVNVQLTPQARRSYQIGLGYGSGSGARASLGTNWNWVNQYGHKFNTLLSWSQTETNLTGQYIIPGKNPATDQYYVNTSINKLMLDNNDNSLAESIGFGQIQQMGQWQRTLGLNLQHEEDEESGVTTIYNLVMPTISFLKVEKDDTININNGSRWLLTIRGAALPLLSSVNFLQGEMQYTKIFTFTENNRVILRGDAGYTAVNAADLPLTVSFYAGGAPLMRGYEPNELGPGRYLLIGSAEYQYRVYGNWWAALIANEGNAMNHFNEPLQRGYGAGVVWRSPFGPIEVTVAQANSLKDKPWRIDFNFGPEL